MVAIEVTDRGLFSKIYKHFMQFNTQKQPNKKKKNGKKNLKTFP